MKKNNIGIYATILAFGLAVVAYLAWPYIAGQPPAENAAAFRANEDNIYLLTHDYVYAVSYEDEGETFLLYLVKNEQNEFDPWEADTAVANANRLYASAVILDSTGTCITSKYAAKPWENESDLNALKTNFAQQLNIQPENIRVDGMTIRMSLSNAKNPGTEWLYERTDGEATENTCYLLPAQEGMLRGFNKLEKGDANGNAVCLLTPTLPGKDDKIELIPLSSLDSTAEGLVTREPVTPMEGTPAFNAEGRLVGIYTRFSRQNNAAVLAAGLIAFFRPQGIIAPVPVQQAAAANTRTRNGITIALPPGWAFDTDAEGYIFSLRSTAEGSTARCTVSLNPADDATGSYQYVSKTRDVLVETMPLEFTDISIYKTEIGGVPAHGFFMLHNSTDGEAIMTALKNGYALTLDFQKMVWAKDSDAMTTLRKSVRFSN